MTRTVRAAGEKPLQVSQKKSPSRIRTARHDVRLIESRLKAARDDYEERYG